MSEMPDVISGETITSEWGNDIRDRTVQRYATVAARTASMPTPVEGDLSYLQDSNTVHVYNGSTWVKLAPVPVVTADIAASNITTALIADGNVTAAKLAGSAVAGFLEVGGATETVEDTTLSTTFEVGATLTFTKPGTWVGFSVLAWGTVHFLGGGTSNIGQARVHIGGNNGTTVMSASGQTTTQPAAFAVGARHSVSGLSANATVRIEYAEAAGGIVHKRSSIISFLAIRTS